VGIGKLALVNVAASPDATSSPSISFFAKAVIAARSISVDNALGVAVAEILRIASWGGLLLLIFIRSRVAKLSSFKTRLLLVSQRKRLGFKKRVLLKNWHD
jgi:hypothetical protein